MEIEKLVSHVWRGQTPAVATGPRGHLKPPIRRARARHVGAEPRMDQRRLLRNRPLRSRYSLARFKVDLHLLGSIERQGVTLREDHSNRVAYMTHNPGSKHRSQGLAHRGAI